MEQRILITGASGGFGFLTCQSLIEKGYKVVGTMRSTKGKNEKVADSLKSIGVHLVEMDVTNEESVNKGVKNAIDLLNGLDVLINNAGISQRSLAKETEPSSFSVPQSAMEPCSPIEPKTTDCSTPSNSFPLHLYHRFFSPGVPRATSHVKTVGERFVCRHDNSGRTPHSRRHQTLTARSRARR